MASQRTREETAQARDMVDAIREMLGMSPLYKEAGSDTHHWLTGVGNAYRDMVKAGGHRGLHKGSL